MTPTMARHLDLCLGCRACESACSSGVPFGHLLEATRAQFERRGVRADGHGAGRRSTSRSSGFLSLAGSRRMMRAAAVLSAIGAAEDGAIARGAGGSVSEAHEHGGAAATSSRGRRRARTGCRPEASAAGGAGLHTGCVQRFFYPDVTRDTARLLSAAGYDVVTPRGQECCGALHLHCRAASTNSAGWPGS